MLTKTHFLMLAAGIILNTAATLILNKKVDDNVRYIYSELKALKAENK